MTEYFVEFVNTQKTYDGKTLVIEDLNLGIKKGEFVTLLGPSGSGKTTALMMLAGFEPPTGGEIRLDGKLLNSVAPFDRNIGMVFQNYALFPHMTVTENVAYPLKVRKTPRAETAERVTRVLDMIQLGTFGDRYPQQLSGGQQQRVAVARALVFNPSLVLMDEPLGALDKKLREEMQIEIRHIHENLGITMVFVTHDQGEALTMSDRVAVFNDGRIQQIDTPARIYEHPANRFVASFIGEANMLHGHVHQSQQGATTVKVAGGVQMAGTAVDTGLAPGDNATLMVRPERVRVDTAANVNGAGIPARLVEKIYYGADAVMVFETKSGDAFRARISAGSPVLNCVVDTETRLSFDVGDARIFAGH